MIGALITKNYPPPKLLAEAIVFVADKLNALDLGAGALVGSKYLLSQGFAVVTVDREKAPEDVLDESFWSVQCSFREYDFPHEYFDLISAQFSLPFNGVDGFDVMWKSMIDSLKPGGVFVGQLFGIHDEWNVEGSNLIFHSRADVEELLSGLEIIKLEEVRKNGTLSNGKPKAWHLFHIIVRK